MLLELEHLSSATNDFSWPLEKILVCEFYLVTEQGFATGALCVNQPHETLGGCAKKIPPEKNHGTKNLCSHPGH